MKTKQKHSAEVQYLIECLVQELLDILMNQYGMTMREALDAVYTSRTMALIEDEESGMYYQSAAYVMSFLSEEPKLCNVAN